MSTQSKPFLSLSVWEIALYPVLGTMTFGAQVVMEVFPNIHLTGMFLILFTLVFRKRALIPLYIYVFLIGIRWGFSLNWLPYLYIWLPLWGGAMLIPRKASVRVKGILSCIIGFLHGILFGILYAPVQAILFQLSFKQTLTWITAGLPWDVTHALGNLFLCTLVPPLYLLLEKLKKKLPR